MRIITLSLCMILVAPALADTYKDLEIADEHNTPAYKRSLYKDGSTSWIDADSDGENTREEVLAEEKVGEFGCAHLLGEYLQTLAISTLTTSCHSKKLIYPAATPGLKQNESPTLMIWRIRIT